MARRQDVLVASVSVVRGPEVDAATSRARSARKSRDNEWQEDAFLAYRTIGEVRFASRSIANALSQVRFFVGKVPDPGRPISPIDPDDPETKPPDLDARDVLERLKGKDGTLAGVVRDYGVQQFVCGESYLVAQDGVVGEQWEVYSVLEWRRLEANKTVSPVTLNPDAAAPVGSKGYVLRLWQRDPADRSRADSSLRPVLGVCDALRTAQQMQVAADRSRIATNGIYWIPSEADLPRTPVPDRNGVERPRLDLIDDLLDVATTAMEDPGSAVAAVPIIATMNGDLIGKAKHETFDRKVDDTIAERIDHLIRRLAQGLDLVPEKLLGVGDVSHWTAWSISEDTVTSHVAPLAVSFCEDLTAGYLRPALKEMQGRGWKGDPNDYALWYDVTDIVVSPNRASHAQWAYEHLLLDGDSTIEALGFSADQRPDDDEINLHVAVIQATTGHPITGVIGTNGKPVIAPPPAPVAPKPPAGEVVPPQDGTPNEQPQDGPPDGAKKPADKRGKPETQPNGGAPPAAPADKGKPPGKSGQQTGRPKRTKAAARSPEAAAALGLAMMAVDRAIERAGARLRTKARASKVAQYAAAAEGDSSVLPLILGPHGVESCGTSVDDLLVGAWEPLGRALADWTDDPLTIQEVVAGVDRVTRRRLFDGQVDVMGAVDDAIDAAFGDRYADADLVGASS